MRWLRRVIGGANALVRRQRLERELDEELRAFLETAVDEKMRSGMSRAEATRAARLETGLVSTDSVRDRVRDVGWETHMERLWQDVRYAGRALRRSPGFTAVAIVTLALGIGINTATFTWLRATLFARLPVDTPEKVVFIWSVSPTREVTRSTTSAADFEEWRSANKTFENLAAALPASYNLAGTGVPIRVTAMRATAEFFDVLGPAAFEGRLFSRDEDAPGASRVAVLSHHFWASRFGGDRGIIGRDITLDGEPYTVIGIAPQAASLLRVDLWTPLALNEAREDRTRRDLLVVGRLAQDTTIEQARAELTSVAARLARDYADTSRARRDARGPWHWVRRHVESQSHQA